MVAWKRVSRKARELVFTKLILVLLMMDDDIDIDGSGEASEPQGEGASHDEVDSIIDGVDGGGGGQYVDLLLFC